MKVALLQAASPDGETQPERIARMEQTLGGLSGVDLVVLPELWSAGYFHFDDYAGLAETMDGPTVAMCSRMARDLQAHVHVGSIIEAAGNGRLKNTSILLSPQGRVIHSYSKVHVFGYRSLESRLLTPGSSLPVVQTPFGRVAGTTCYDLRFPGLWMELSSRGAELVIVPAAWPAARREHWRLLTSARALEHQIFVLACNAVGEQAGVALGGHSRVVDPSGAVLAEAGDEEEVLTVDIDPDQVRATREEFPVLADRLPAYDQLAQHKGQ